MVACGGVYVVMLVAMAVGVCGVGEGGWRDEQVVLSPAELLTLVRREQWLPDSPVGSTETTDSSDTSEEDDQDVSPRTRKVWSRWSRWSKCSTTCGPGVLARRRLCVAGRCAPGELEEQQRVCEQAPCSSTADPRGGADSGGPSDPQLNADPDDADSVD